MKNNAPNNEETTFMDIAMDEASAAAARGEVPVGAILVNTKTKQIVAKAGNRVEELKDPTAHAEMLVIRQAASQLGSPRLEDHDLYVTLEPCPMCATAISFARLNRVYFAAYDPKGGGIDHGPQVYNHPTCHHKPDVYGGIGERAAAEMLKDFFKKRR